MYRRDDWLSFEDAESIKARGSLIQKYGLAGARLYGFEQDDFDNRCKTECAFPLTRTINNAIGNDVDCSFRSNKKVMELSATNVESDSSDSEPNKEPKVIGTSTTVSVSRGRSLKQDAKTAELTSGANQYYSSLFIVEVVLVTRLVNCLISH